MRKYHNYMEKSVISIDYVQPSLPHVRMILGACFGLGPFALDMTIETMVRGPF